MNETDNVQPIDLQHIKRVVAAGKKDPYGEAEGEVRHPIDLEKHNKSSTVILCKDIADLLVRNYPGWAWAVQPQEFGGVINVFNLHLHSQFAFTIRIQDIQHDARRRLAIRAGGEILRRFRMPNKMDPKQLKEAPRDARGECIPDVSDLPDKKARLNAEIAMGLATGKMEVVEMHDGKRYLKVNNE